MSATSDRDNTNTGSAKTFVTALIGGLLVFGAEFAIYLYFHHKQKKVYQPRTYLALDGRRPQELPSNPIKWFLTIWNTPTEDVLTTNGLDAYAFTRLLRLYLRMFIPYFVLTWCILMPVTAVKPNNGQDGLNLFVIGNVGQTVQSRLAAHLIVCWLMTLFIFYLIYEEVVNFVQVKHDYLGSPLHLAQSRARTVLLTSVPSHMMNENAIRDYAAPGNVERIWLIRDIKEVNEVYDEREKNCTTLEGAEGKILALASKRVRKGKATAPKAGNAQETGDYGLINSVVPQKKRPTHRLGKIPFIGKKVDSIDYCSEHIKTDSDKLEKMRENPDQYQFATSAIIRFSNQADAIIFSQNLDKKKAKMCGGRFPDVAPNDIIWKNLGLNAKVLPAKRALSWGITIYLILIWAIPVAFVGSLSNLSGLCTEASFLAWVCKLPSPVVGIIQGIAPPVGLAILFFLLPIVLRKLAELQGIPLVTLVDLSVYKRYWWFLIIHGFLIVTISGALTSALGPAIDHPEKAPTLLAQKLPQSATFFLTYLITTALSNAGKFLTQAVGVVVLLIMRFLGGATPRKIWKLEYTLPSTTFFQLMPNVDLLVVLGLVYSVLQPIITLLALIAFFLYYISFKYQFGWVYAQPAAREANGIYFQHSIDHVFVGLYIQQLCLIGEFFLSTGSSGKRSAIPEAVLMIVLLIMTIAFQVYLRWKFPTKSISLEQIPSRSSAHPYLVNDAKKKQANGAIGANGTDGTDGTNGFGNNISEEEEEHGFEPPAMYKPQPPVWIANDTLGLGVIETNKLNASGVNASTENTTMNEKGKVDVSGRPGFIDQPQ